MAIATILAMTADFLAMLLVGGMLYFLLLVLHRKINLNKIYYLFLIFYLLSYYHAEGLLQKPIIDELVNQEKYIVKGIYGEATGVVTQIADKGEYIQFVISGCDVEVSDLTDTNICLLVNSYDAELITAIKQSDTTDRETVNSIQIGDSVTVKGKIKAIPAARNEGEFDSLSYYRSIGIDYKMNASKLEKTESGKQQLLPFLMKLRARLKQVYKKVADQKEAGIYQSIVLGDKSDLDAEIKDLYQVNGIAHLLAISGLHIALLGMTLYHLLRRSGLTFLPAGFISGLIMISYGMMTGNGISATRAIIMFLFSIVAEITGRTYDILSAMSFSAMYLILQNPYVILNSGFLLSFGAIIGITLIEPAMEKITAVEGISNVLLKHFIQSVLISISINLATLPIILYNYFQIPTYSFLLNLLVIPFMSIVMICSVIAGFAGMLSMQAGMFFLGGAHYILRLYEFLCNCNTQLPYATIVLGRPSMQKIVLYYLILTVVIVLCRLCTSQYSSLNRSDYEHGEKNRAYPFKIVHKMERLKEVLGQRKMNRIISICLLVLAVSFLCPDRRTDKLSIRMIDVGQGDGILIQTPEHVNYLFDGGSTDIKQVGKYRILPVLKSNAVTCLDYVVMSHSDSDHISGILELMEKTDHTFAIKNLVVPNIINPDEAYLNLIDTALSKDINVIYVNAGDQIGTGQVNITCIHPAPQYAYDSANDYSANYMVSYKEFDMLMTGDVEKQGEQSMLATGRYTDIDVLKVAHHGSNSSTTQEMLDQTRPEIGIISCGIDNSYGHPSPETIEKLEKAKVRTYVTNQCGEIIIETDGKSMEISTYLK